MHRVFYGILIAAILLVSVPANSATIVKDGSGYVTGINGLEVNSVSYNVDFVYNSYNQIWSSSTPEFWADASGAEIAVLAINTVLNDDAIPPPVILDASGTRYFVPWRWDGAATLIETKYGQRFDSGWSTSSPLKTDPNFSYHYATFSQVPIPGAIWLLGSGLIGIVGIRKKFKK